MIKDLKTFIKTYKNLINTRDFGSRLFSEYYGRTVWIDFLELLEKLNVDPLMHLGKIPKKFYQNSRIKKIDILNHITSIGEAAFYNCSRLESLSISNRVKSIEEETFIWCSSLTSITIPDSVTHIGVNAFSHCGSLTNIIIPDSVMYIGGGAFSCCSGLTNITIGGRVKTIGEFAFNNCSLLVNLSFNGTRDQWEKITKGHNWNPPLAKVVICKDGELNLL